VKLEQNDMCFGCGKKNECGLQLKISFENGKAHSEVIFRDVHQGWKGIVHGGVIAAALDEMMAYAFGSLGARSGVTAKLEIKFKKPIRVGEKYIAIAEVIEFNGRKAKIKGRIEKSGAVYAEGEGIYVAVKEVKA
jgi:uncharacterized protein (TIGR00369 family)